MPRGGFKYPLGASNAPSGMFNVHTNVQTLLVFKMLVKFLLKIYFIFMIFKTFL